MANLVETITLEDGNTKRVYDDGSYQVVDESGKFVGGSLTSERASQIAKSRTHKAKAEKADDVTDLLDELGLTSTSARLLAQQFAGGGSQAIHAARELFKMAHVPEDSESATFATTGHYIVPKEGERCPRCGLTSTIPPKVAHKLLDLIEAHKPVSRTPTSRKNHA